MSLAGGGLAYLVREGDLGTLKRHDELSVDRRATPVASVEVPVSSAPVAAEGEPFVPLVWPDGAVPDELVMSFANRSDLEAFLREAKRAGLGDLAVIPGLNLVRVRVENDEEARRAWKLAGNATVALNPVVANPEVPPLEGAGGGHVPFGDQALAWMGVPDDNSKWGEGVRIAVLDTGVGDHPSLANASITHMSVLDAEARLAGVGTHGTAVASLLVGQGDVRGIVPAADLMSVQVLGADGAGSGFDLANGIIEAVNGGANIINLSLGSQTDSAFLREAVAYARSRGAVLVASGGNDGAGNLLYPAAYEGVFAVGAVDGNGQHVPFSNRGDNLAVAAPGLGMTAAGPDGTMIEVSGTSFSGPLAAGSLAYLSQSMGAWEAVDTLKTYANDGGAPGADGIYGEGWIDLERVDRRNEPGIHDLAVADHFYNVSGEEPEMLITVENRGTEPAGNIDLKVVVNGDSYLVPVENLPPNEATAARIPLAEFLGSPEGVEILSRVAVPGATDVRPDNDVKGSFLQFKQPEE